MVQLDGILDGEDGVQERAVVFESGVGKNISVLRADEAAPLQSTDIFADGVCAETAVLADGCVAGVALKCFSVFDGQEIRFETMIVDFISRFLIILFVILGEK